ncbi:hypothetical protein Tco_0027923 [Tanacetum coccineum]
MPGSDNESDDASVHNEHIAVQRESKARTTLLQSIPDDHVADFHYMDDARDIWNAVKARFGGNAESKKMRKSMLNQRDCTKGMTGCKRFSVSLTNSRPSLMMKTSILSFLEVCLHLGHKWL